MSTFSRRHALSLLGVGAGAALTGCNPSGGGQSPTPGDAGYVPAPTYVPLPGAPEPAIAGTPDGVIPPTYFRYPDQPATSVTEPPGDGQPVTILTQSFSPTPPPPEKNGAWAGLNEALGSPLDVQITMASEYSAKFATVVAGSQLPDLFYIGELAKLDQFVQSTCLDLSDHLSGDNLLKYPNLAAIPSACWEAGRFGGRLYGLPSPRGAMSSGVLYRRDDLLRAKGVETTIDSFETFYALCEEINDPRAEKFACSIAPLQYIRNMLRIPNFWQFRDGAMHSWWTASEQELALSSARRMVEAGLTHPDAYISPATKTWFGNGSVIFNPDSVSAWSQYLASAPDDLDMAGCEIPAFDGDGQGALWLSFPSFGRSAIARGSEARVETLLGVANYLAAPFGTKEYLTVKYGVEGSDYTMTDGSPQQTAQGTANTELGVKYIVDAALVNFLPGHEADARKLDALLRDLVPDAFNNDAVYLPSETVSDHFERDNKQFQALESDILAGRKPVSDWRPAADAWWSEHGQQMADELSQAYVDAGRG